MRWDVSPWDSFRERRCVADFVAAMLVLKASEMTVASERRESSARTVVLRLDSCFCCFLQGHTDSTLVACSSWIHTHAYRHTHIHVTVARQTDKHTHIRASIHMYPTKIATHLSPGTGPCFSEMSIPPVLVEWICRDAADKSYPALRRATKECRRENNFPLSPAVLAAVAPARRWVLLDRDGDNTMNVMYNCTQNVDSVCI